MWNEDIFRNIKDTQNQQIMKFITDNHNEIRFSSDKEEYQRKSIT